MVKRKEHFISDVDLFLNNYYNKMWEGENGKCLILMGLYLFRHPYKFTF